MVCKSCHDLSPALRLPLSASQLMLYPPATLDTNAWTESGRDSNPLLVPPLLTSCTPQNQPWAWRKLPTRAPGSPLIKGLYSQPRAFLKGVCSPEGAAPGDLSRWKWAGRASLLPPHRPAPSQAMSMACDSAPPWPQQAGAMGEAQVGLWWIQNQKWAQLLSLPCWSQRGLCRGAD